MTTGSADGVWNRACLVGEVDGLRVGDRMLALVIRFDAVAQNGGVEHAIGFSGSDGLRRAVEGFRWFGLDEIAAWIEAAAKECETRIRHGGEELGGDAELQRDRVYYALADEGGGIQAAFRARWTARPEDFAPL